MLLVALGLAAVDAVSRARRPTYVVAWTSCPVRGPARITIGSAVDSQALPAVMAHEQVHAAQCAALGPVRYWATNVRPGGRLQLEAPAYCAYARQRLTVDPDTEYQRDRLHEDLITAMRAGDSDVVKQALLDACPEIASKPRRTRSPARLGR